MVLSVAQQKILGTSLLACGLVVGCGGGGGGSTPAAAPVAAPVTPPVTTPVVSPVVELGSTVITGVVSTGAPVMGGLLRVIDATGAEVRLLDAAGTVYPPGQSVVSTNVADGSYRLNLASASQSLPLLLQVSGVDAAGLPVVLHSVLASNTLPLVANVTPLTEAVLAQIVGANPRDLWAAAAANATAIKQLGTATVVTAASNLIKTVIKSNLTDGKITNTTTLDFFRDSSFLANKTGLDLALEGMRIQIVKTSAGLDQLQLSNKFASYAAPEVKIDLLTAKTELAKTTGTVMANAIVSTLKATTSPTTVLANLGSLDNLTAQLNTLIAQSSPVSTATTFTGSVLVPSTGTYIYAMHNGRTKSQLADLLLTYTASNWQLGRLLVTGCADDPVPTAGCSRLAVSTLVSDYQGNVKFVFSNVASYQIVPGVAAIAPVPAVGATPAVPGVAAIPPQPAQWRLVGNGAQTQFDILPATYGVYNAAGGLVASTTAQPNPVSSVVANFRGMDWSATPASKIREGLVQSLSNFVIRFSDCDMSSSKEYLCINPAPSSSVTPAPYTGDLQDVLIKPLYVGWVGSSDTVAGAKYAASFALGVTSTPTYSQNAYLKADVPVTPQATFLPVLDTPPTIALLTSGGLLRWTAWAAANPHMKMKSVRLIVNSSPPVAIDYALPVTGAIDLDLSVKAAPAAAASYRLLLTSQDHLGRFFYSAVSVDQ